MLDRADSIEIVNSKSDLPGGGRGGIIAPEFVTSKAEAHAEIEPYLEYDEDAVRGALLLFDVIDSPKFTYLKARSGGSFPINTPEGIEKFVDLRRTIVANRGEYVTLKSVQDGFLNVLDNHSREYSGLWAICRGSSSIFLRKSELNSKTAFKLSLINSLPIPSREVPYEDVMLFKERRRSELVALRHYLNTLEMEVYKNGFDKLSQSIAFEKLQKSFDDYYKAIKEKNFSKRIMSVDITFGWDKLVSDPAIMIGATAAIQSFRLGMPFFDAALSAVVGASAMIAVKSTAGLLGGKNISGPFDYLFYAEREL